MDYRANLFLLLICMLFGYGHSYCYSCDGAGEYCCGDYCCYSVYLSWWFWLIVVALFILKVSCITCYIRARRRRQQMFYVQTPVTTATVTLQQPPRPAPGQMAPHQQMAPPPPYPTQPPAYAPPQAAYGQQPPQNPYVDSKVNKDTELLVG